MTQELPEDVAPTLVLGLGDERRRDAGVGLVAARALEGEGLPEGVELNESSIEVMLTSLGALDAVTELAGRARAVIITAAQMGLPPGEVRSFTPEELADAPVLPLPGQEGPSLQDALELAALAMPVASPRGLPALRIVVVQPGEVAPGTGLTPPVGAAIPKVLAQVRRALEEMLAA